MRGRDQSGSKGPKVKFNKLEGKSKSKSKRPHKPRASITHRSTKGINLFREPEFNLTNHKPKIIQRHSPYTKFRNKAKELNRHKPPLSNAHPRPVNIERVKYKASNNLKASNSRQKSYNSLIQASEKLKQVATVLKNRPVQHSASKYSFQNSYSGLMQDSAAKEALTAYDVCSPTSSIVSVSHTSKPFTRIGSEKRVSAYYNKPSRWEEPKHRANTEICTESDTNTRNLYRNEAKTEVSFIKSVVGGDSFVKYLQSS